MYKTIKIQTLNQPGSYSTFTVELNQQKLGEVLGWNPEGKYVLDILHRLQSGKVVEVLTRQVPKVKGTDSVRYLMTPQE